MIKEGKQLDWSSEGLQHLEPGRKSKEGSVLEPRYNQQASCHKTPKKKLFQKEGGGGEIGSEDNK